MTLDHIAEIIWREYGRWDGVPAPTPKDTWGYKAAEKIAERLDYERRMKQGD